MPGGRKNGLKMNDWWFDGDFSECYYAWNEHADKEEFANFILDEENLGGYEDQEVDVDRIEYLWAKEINDERFELVPEGTPGAIPITRYKPW